MSRRAAMAKVHIARKELGLDEDTYRDVLARVTGRTSSADCSDAQLGQVLEEFKALGWTPKVVAGGKLRGRKGTVVMDDPLSPYRHHPADHPSAKKARALWLSLWNLGEVRDPSEAALESFARRQLKVERLQWADQALVYKLIEALKAMAERAGWSQDLSGVAGPGQIRTLKRRLLVAQHRRLHLPDPDGLPGFTERQLDEQIASLGKAIRTAAEAAR